MCAQTECLTTTLLGMFNNAPFHSCLLWKQQQQNASFCKNTMQQKKLHICQPFQTLLYVVMHVFHHFIVCFFPWVESLRFVAILRSRAELPSSWRLSLQRNNSRLCQNILLRVWAWAHHWQGFRFWTLKPASESGWAAGSNLSSVRSAPSSHSALSPGRYF